MTLKPKPGSKPESKHWMLYVVFVALVSWVGLWGVVMSLPVNGTTHTLFLFLLFSAITSTVMPPVSYLNTRFAKFRNRRTYWVRFVRQSIWCGAFVVVVAWLQMQRVLSATLALILMAVFVLIETFLVTREIPA